MRSSALVLLLAAAACGAPVAGDAGRGAPAADAPRPADTLRPDWADAFAARGGVGTFVLYHPATGVTERLDADRAARRYLPASTFKLYNALVAVETGVVGDVDSAFVWDGVVREVDVWNQDHSLRSGLAVSAVWLYQRVARRVGRERYQAALAREPYGNGVVGDALDLFWLDGSLRISADEQVRFADRLRTGRTAFSDATEATVREIVPVLVDAPRARMRAKTGWGGFDRAPGERVPLGWLVGWVERAEADGGDVVFALNVEPAPGVTDFAMGPARLAIARDILAREGVLPAP